MPSDALAWANLLLIPVVGMLVRISSQIAALMARSEAHSKRMDLLERSAFD